MRYLTVQDVLLLHDLAIEASGGSHGLRDLGLLESALARPQATFASDDLYPTILNKAAALLHSLLRNHAFIDGNKRTSMLAAMTFLELNGYRFSAEQDEIVSYALKIGKTHLSIDDISSWLQDHTSRK